MDRPSMIIQDSSQESDTYPFQAADKPSTQEVQIPHNTILDSDEEQEHRMNQKRTESSFKLQKSQIESISIEEPSEAKFQDEFTQTSQQGQENVYDLERKRNIKVRVKELKVMRVEKACFHQGELKFIVKAVIHGFTKECLIEHGVMAQFYGGVLCEFYKRESGLAEAVEKRQKKI